MFSENLILKSQIILTKEDVSMIEFSNLTIFKLNDNFIYLDSIICKTA